MKISQVLRMWYVYNRRGIENSDDLCRTVTSHKAMMTKPQDELDRIYQDLRDCGLNVPRKVHEKDTKSFIDVKLQHGKFNNNILILFFIILISNYCYLYLFQLLLLYLFQSIFFNQVKQDPLICHVLRI
jgi:hypothetical protein